MAYKSGMTGPCLPSTSFSINVFLVLAALLCQSLVNAGEISEEIGNQVEETGTTIPSSTSVEKDGDDMLMYKRHLGSIAALSGQKPYSGNRFIISPPSKKHVGSIAAAQSMGIRGIGGRTLDMYKRHLGSLMALSGQQKPRPLTRSPKEPLEYLMDASTDNNNLNLDSLPMKYSDYGLDYQGGGPREPISPYLMLYPDSSVVQEEEVDAPMKGENIEDENDDEASVKSKRFLGSLARSNWFPRHFRGVMPQNTYAKRHIGSAARLGWVPHSKMMSRLNMLDQPQHGELGLKRNDLASRTRMLYHFAAPSLWTSPRGK